MCVTFFNTNPDELFILFNREESPLRSTDPLHNWPDDPNIIAGKDNALGGTWFGVNKKTGNFSFLTNLSDEKTKKVKFAIGKLSRGLLIKSFLVSDFERKGEEVALGDIELFMDRIIDQADKYNPFNMCVGNLKINKFFYIDIVSKQITKLNKGELIGFSNNWFNQTKRNRVENGLKMLEQLKKEKIVDNENLLKIMKNEQRYKGETWKDQYPIFITPNDCIGDLHKEFCISTVCLMRTGKGEFKVTELSYKYNLEKIKIFMLKKKYKHKLTGYVRFLMFLIKMDKRLHSIRREEIEFTIK